MRFYNAFSRFFICFSADFTILFFAYFFSYIKNLLNSIKINKNSLLLCLEKKQHNSLSKYIYYLNTTCLPGHFLNGFMATDAFGHIHVQLRPKAPVAIKPLW